MDTGIEVKVEDYDGTYVCLFCGESVRGQPALKCSHCSCNPFHLACVALAHSKYAEVCPTCDRKTVEAWGRASGGPAGPSEIIDLREVESEGEGAAEVAALTGNGARAEAVAAEGGTVVAADVVGGGVQGERNDAGRGGSGKGKEPAEAAAGLEAGGEGGAARAGAGGVGGGGKGKVGTEKELVCRCCERRASGCATPWTAAAVRLACLRACHGRTGASSSVARTGGGKRGPSRSHPVNPRPPKRAVRLLEWQCGVAMAAANEAEWASWRARIHQAQVLERFYALSQDRPLVPVRAPAETVFDLSSATTNPSACTCCRT